MKKLTTRQWKLYYFIKINSGRGVVVDYNDILHEDKFKELYSRTTRWADKKRRIRGDVEVINQHQTVIQKPIINSGYGYYIPDSVDVYKAWSDIQWKRLKKMIKELADKDRKVAYNSQYRIVFDENSKAKDCVEALIEHA